MGDNTYNEMLKHAANITAGEERAEMRDKLELDSRRRAEAASNAKMAKDIAVRQRVDEVLNNLPES